MRGGLSVAPLLTSAPLSLRCSACVCVLCSSSSTRKRPRNQAAAGVIPGTLAPLPSAMMATVKVGGARVLPAVVLAYP